MPRSTTPFLTIKLLLLLLLTSCASHKVTEGYADVTPKIGSYDVPYFSNPETDYVYKANIRAYGNELTGIFIAKKINDTFHRVVLTTEFGNKLIDFEISEHDFKINHIVSELDRKIIINTLRDDFRLLLKTKFKIAEAFENNENIVYRSPEGKESDYLFVSKSTDKLVKIVRTSNRKEKINLSFTTENNIFAQKVIIHHENIQLDITLNFFKQTN